MMRRLANSIRLSGLAFACFLGHVPLCPADVVFEHERLLLKAAPDQDQLTAEFVFRNDGSQPVTVVSVQSSCSCLVAEGPKEPVPAGAKGVVRGVFKVGAFKGIAEKQLVVHLESAGKKQEVPLTLAMEMPEIIRIEPNTLTWQVGAPLLEQSFDVRMVWPEAIRVLSIDSSREEFDLRVETIEDGKHYKIIAKPRDLSKPMLGLIQIKTDCRFEKFRNPMAFLSIRTAP